MNSNDIKCSSINKVILVLCLITLCSVRANASILPPDPDNAALLYYQAFLLRPEPDYVAKELVYRTPAEQFFKVLTGGKLEFGTETEEQIREYEKYLKGGDADPNTKLSDYEFFMLYEENKGYIHGVLNSLRKRREHEEKMRGVDPNQVIRKYMRDCREAIEVAQIASEMSKCRWGFRYSEGNAFITPLLIEIRELSIALRTDAFLLAADGHLREAFERCLMLRRIGRHVGDDSWFFYTDSSGIGSGSLLSIRIILGNTKPDLPG